MQSQLHFTPPSSHLPFSRHFPRSQIPPSQIRVRVSYSKLRNPNPNPSRSPNSHAVRAKKKENVWSVDNEIASMEAAAEERREKKGRNSLRQRRKGRGEGRREKKENGLVLVSAAMLMEVETVLQMQEPVIKPSWDTFASSVSGIWKGVGAVFSPFTAEMEPLGVGNKNENLYDCYTLSRIERATSEGLRPLIQRKTNWVFLNPFGENRQHFREGRGDNNNKDRFESEKGTSDAIHDLPSYESFDFTKSDVLEEDLMFVESGLVFFEDGSYSRGPVDIPVGEFDDSKYFLSPTFKFEQCLVKGCHKRLRIVHTIEFGEGGSNLQIIRVAVYEEQWVSPVNLYDGNMVGGYIDNFVHRIVNSDDLFDLKPLSQRKRTQPSELAGSWKVFEVSATPIFNDNDAMLAEEGGGGGGSPAYVYLCMETLKKRSLPDVPAYFLEEEALDARDATVLWLPGGVTGYVDVSKDGTLCIGVGWYSEEGVNLVMERDYGTDGKLKEVRSKSEVKRRWTDPDPTLS